MPVNQNVYKQLIADFEKNNSQLVAVTKYRSIEDVNSLYNYGQRKMGENKVQEILRKAPLLPENIEWHMIGHLQKNKVSKLLPFVNMIHSVDSLELLLEIEKQAAKIHKDISILLQVHISDEEQKHGFDLTSFENVFFDIEKLNLKYSKIVGLMGMASFTDDQTKIRKEFKSLKHLYDQLSKNNSNLSILSMGMSGDYQLAIESGSNMVRIGSLLFE
jgi:pyridoxal phosphate enzyme (YggS family)